MSMWVRPLAASAPRQVGRGGILGAPRSWDGGRAAWIEAPESLLWPSCEVGKCQLKDSHPHLSARGWAVGKLGACV